MRSAHIRVLSRSEENLMWAGTESPAQNTCCENPHGRDGLENSRFQKAVNHCGTLMCY